jgi:N-acetylmuramoyl-L-alanine amidase
MKFKNSIVLIVVVVVMILISFTSLVTAATVSDISGHWAKDNIQSLVDRGIIKGYPDGTFKPENPITRAEFCTIITSALVDDGVITEYVTTTGTFTDVPADLWSVKYIETAYANGFVLGKGNGLFDPGANITRQEMARIISLVYCQKNTADFNTLRDDYNIGDYNLSDLNTADTWAMDSIKVALKMKLMIGNDNGIFAPQGQVTRAETATVTSKILGYTYSQTQLNYSKSGDRVYLSIPNTILTDVYGKTKYYTETLSSDRKTYSITYQQDAYQPDATSILSGIYNVNDNFLNYISVTKNDSTGEITVTFCAKDDFIYNISYRELSKDSAITIIKPYAKNDDSRSVFIDVGHGGEDPGAYYKDNTIDVKEKELNLDIAKRLNILLKENNINTYLDRGDDTFVGLYERCNIANAMNSKVFVSIHNNAADPSSASGTLTLYYPLPDSKRLAEIVQNSLINTLGTYDRKVVVGDDLVVLKATNMTSIITETVFISNKDDRDKIMDPEFRQKAAEAICNGIIEYLNGL